MIFIFLPLASLYSGSSRRPTPTSSVDFANYPGVLQRHFGQEVDSKTRGYISGAMLSWFNRAWKALVNGYLLSLYIYIYICVMWLIDWKLGPGRHLCPEVLEQSQAMEAIQKDTEAPPPTGNWVTWLNLHFVGHEAMQWDCFLRLWMADQISNGAQMVMSPMGSSQASSVCVCCIWSLGGAAASQNLFWISVIEH